MKLIKNIPKKLFRRKKSRSIPGSEFDPAFFSSTDDSQTRFRNPTSGSATPTSVLPADELSDFELKQAFKMIDRDGDGKITEEELEALLIRVGAEPPSQEELRLMLSDVDVDGDGCISLEEFYAIGSAFGPPACDDELKETFDYFDSNRDGKITAEELYNVFRTIGDGRCTLDDCRRMIKGVDKNRDGFVCFEDFTRMMELQL
ncbi:unnamed protein product [Fraxinus pennsylvanica]|uniref:EF-hand domain-containing protein n=1 Tax=Fraxinus pennsylvanica TaxID=56036 RepID=A0AAD2DSM6_9LAMI|nr:unnamed protein product [Fraxinus pennsylvanica]